MVLLRRDGIRIRSDPLLYGHADPALFSLDPTCNNGFIKLFLFWTEYEPESTNYFFPSWAGSGSVEKNVGSSSLVKGTKVLLIFQKHIKNALYTEFTRNINRFLCSDLLYKNGLDFFDILYTRKTCKVDPFSVLIVVHSVQLSNKHNPWYYLLFFHCLFLRVLIFQSFQFSSKKKDKKNDGILIRVSVDRL